ncbi:hypothetical protein [Sinomonas soli]
MSESEAELPRGSYLIRLQCTNRGQHKPCSVRLDYDRPVEPPPEAEAGLILPRFISAVENDPGGGQPGGFDVLVLWTAYPLKSGATRRGNARESIGFRYGKTGNTFAFSCKRCRTNPRIPGEKLDLLCAETAAQGIGVLDISSLE